MAAWANDELDAIGDAEELTLASARRDGTLRNPVTMWVVRGDDLYVRSVNGRSPQPICSASHETLGPTGS